MNKEFKNIKGPAVENPAKAHQDMDNDSNVQQFIQNEVLPEVEKDIEREKNADN